MSHKAPACRLSPEDEQRVYKRPTRVKGLERFQNLMRTGDEKLAVLTDLPPEQVKRGDVIIGRRKRSDRT